MTDAPGRPPAAHSWDFEPGDEIAPGRSVVRSLGGGRRFDALLVWDDLLFSLAVAKVIRPDQAHDERALRELRGEAEALERLRHPVIVRGFGADLDGPHPHVLIEHLEGPTLRSLIRRHGALGIEQALPLCANIAAALHYLATVGMVHLDVKPDNIVMGLPPRLIDLSIATSLERAARIGGPIGTDAYMAPEQCDPRGHPGAIGPASDVWGLGATLHHAVSGRRPFPRPRGGGESTDPEVRWPQLVREPEPLGRKVPAALRELISATLAPRPDDRPGAAEVALGLEPLIAELPRKLLLARGGTRLR